MAYRGADAAWFLVVVFGFPPLFGFR